MDPIVIEGGKFDVPAQELRDHCLARAVHHGEQATKHTERLKLLHDRAGELLDADEIPDEAADYAAGASNFKGMVRENDVKGKAVHHHRRSKWFTFVASHLTVGALYRLSMHEIDTFEFIRA